MTLAAEAASLVEGANRFTSKVTSKVVEMNPSTLTAQPERRSHSEKIREERSHRRHPNIIALPVSFLQILKFYESYGLPAIRLRRHSAGKSGKDCKSSPARQLARARKSRPEGCCRPTAQHFIHASIALCCLLVRHTITQTEQRARLLHKTRKLH